MDSNTIQGPTAKRWWRSTLTDSGRPLVWTIPVDSDGSLMWDRCHWKLYEILFPSIYRTSKTESICVLGINFGAACSWIPRWSRSRVGLGLPCDVDVLAAPLRHLGLSQVLAGPLQGS